MKAKTIKQLAREFEISVPKMIEEITQVPGLQFNKTRLKGKKVRIIFPVDLVKIYNHLGSPAEF